MITFSAIFTHPSDLENILDIRVQPFTTSRTLPFDRFSPARPDPRRLLPNMAVMDMLEEGEVKGEKVDGGTMISFILLFVLSFLRPVSYFPGPGWLSFLGEL